LAEFAAIDEAHATGGDICRLLDVFGLSVENASRDSATVTSTACVQV